MESSYYHQNNHKNLTIKNNNKINISKYLSKIISIKKIKLYSGVSKNKKNYDNSESKIEDQSQLLAKKELEIKTLKLKCEKLQEENNKYQLQKNIYLNNNKQNTSSNFPLKNEIKALWEKFSKINILNNFIDFEDEPEIIFHIISELFLLSNKLIKEKNEFKFREISKIMGVKNNSLVIKDIEDKFKNFMKEHLDEIYLDLNSNNFIYEYKQKIKKIFKEKIINKKDDVNKEKIYKTFCDILEQNDFKEILKDINDLILITQYNEPPLSFNIEPNFINRKIKIIQIKKKKNYIILNDSIIKCINYIIILNPPQLKNGIYYFNNLKTIIMPFNRNYSEYSLVMEKEEIKDIFTNNDELFSTQTDINNNRLINFFNQKNSNINLIDNYNNTIKKLKINNKFKKSIGMFSNMDLNIRKKKKIKNLEINDSLKKKYEKYWKTFNVENLNLFESINNKTKKKKEKPNKLISISNEKIKRPQITNYIHNTRRKYSFGYNDMLNMDKYLMSIYKSEEKNKNYIKKNLNITGNIRNWKNKNELVNSYKFIKIRKNNSNNNLINKKFIIKSTRKNSQVDFKYCKKCINLKKDSKSNSKNISKNEKKGKKVKGTLIKNFFKNKKGNLCLEEESSNNYSRTKPFETNKSNNDIKCKIKNFNINYINIGNSGNILGVNNSNIYNYNNKMKILKDNNVNKNSFLFLPIDDIQKIIENNITKNKKYSKKITKNTSVEYYNKTLNKTSKNNNKSVINTSLKKKLTWIKNENSVKVNERKNNSNNITRRDFGEKNILISNYIKSNINKKSSDILNKSKNKLNYMKKNISINNNIKEYSQYNSTLSSERKICNNTNERIYKKKIYDNFKNNIDIDLEEQNHMYIKLIKKKGTTMTTNSNKQYNLMNNRIGKKKNFNSYKEKNFTKNKTELNLCYKLEKEKNK